MFACDIMLSFKAEQNPGNEPLAISLLLTNVGFTGRLISRRQHACADVPGAQFG
jgi:hypothetical protein